MGCLNEKDLSSYLDEQLSGSERARIEEHLAVCNACLDMLLVAREAAQRDKGKPRGKKRTEIKWLLAALFFFALSFLIKSYFLQFLTASAVLGFKWAMEGEGARRVVMIFRDMQKKDKDFERKLPTLKR